MQHSFKAEKIRSKRSRDTWEEDKNVVKGNKRNKQVRGNEFKRAWSE